MRRDDAVDHAVWEASKDIAEAVAGSATPAELGQQVMATIDRMVECDFGSILSVAPGQDWAIAGQKGDNRILRENHWRYAQEMTPGELQHLAAGFSSDTELFEPKRRDRMSVYHDFIAPNRQAGFIARYWFMDGQLWGVGMSRGRPSFSPRERARLEALFPHVKAALRAGTWLVDDAQGTGARGRWSLTPAEERTMSLVLRGLTNNEVAALLGNSPNTVRNTLAQVFRKVGVSRRSELAFIVRGATSDDGRNGERDRPVYQRQLAAINAIKTAP